MEQCPDRWDRHHPKHSSYWSRTTLPLDISMASLPKLKEFQANSVIEYLRLTDKDKVFATEVLKMLVEDRRTTHRERINNKRNVVTLQKGDIVMARREVMSNKDKDRVGKLT